MKEQLEKTFRELYDLSNRLRLIRDEITKMQEDIAPFIRE